jgi:hypothetical protein
MLLVIFGAGASYDSVPSRPPSKFPNIEERLPLANQLFADRGLFNNTMRRFPRCLAIVPYLQQMGASDSIERILVHLG